MSKQKKYAYGYAKVSFFEKLNKLANMRMYATSQQMEFMEFAVFSLIAILVPLTLKHPQLLVGSAVNLMLILAAINTRGLKKLVPLIVLPSIAAFAGGFLFGSISWILLYMMAFIWIGNSILVFAFKYLYVAKKKNYAATLLLGAAAKAAFLFASASMLVALGIIPQAIAAKILTAFGIMQFVTATIGGIAAFPVTVVYRRYFEIEK